ncbi:hypothetical protein nbrc107696_12870 [Gordonia spumicola]|uniref:MurNAc-LAA domain-containing protein n=1 Tax=Gordonia spumicola TaxID=589161 RepID=A0A7I9V6Z5_9ACTN|nr:N-acetylmuramoyl-L-alanine amidase [Gordonia spumicola]GEE00841.1 hypothetical protein nbrc107696_12870 [Gordonia spumicola]
MTSVNFRESAALALVVGFSTLLAACTSPQDSGSPVKTVTVTTTAASSSTTAAPRSSADSGCRAPVVALDPGHNGQSISVFDKITGVEMRDYPNGAEDADVFAVATTAKRALERAGYTVVLLKKNTSESVTYRQRVDRAERAEADIGISIHTSPGEHSVFDQRLGGYREGTGADGQTLRVTFKNADLARKSGRLSSKFATARSQVEGRQVNVVQNNFGGRAPLWAGDLPMISLISQKVPWVYSEFGTVDGGGGSNPIGPTGRSLYARSIVAATKAAVPNTCE